MNEWVVKGSLTQKWGQKHTTLDNLRNFNGFLVSLMRV